MRTVRAPSNELSAGCDVEYSSSRPRRSIASASTSSGSIASSTIVYPSRAIALCVRVERRGIEHTTKATGVGSLRWCLCYALGDVDAGHPSRRVRAPRRDGHRQRDDRCRLDHLATGGAARRLRAHRRSARARRSRTAASIHCTAELPTIVGDDCVIGHLVHLECCTIEDRRARRVGLDRAAPGDRAQRRAGRRAARWCRTAWRCRAGRHGARACRRSCGSTR